MKPALAKPPRPQSASGSPPAPRSAGPVESIYRWDGKIESAKEWYVHFKTTVARAPDLRSRLRGIHPYDTPEIIVLPIADGDPAYLRWIEASVAPGT